MEWISCTERLPEKSGRYLVTRGSNVCGSLWDKVDILNYSERGRNLAIKYRKVSTQ